MRILGIDPGSRVAGFAIIEISQSRLKYINSGVVKAPLDKDFFYRLPFFQKKFEEIF